MLASSLSIFASACVAASTISGVEEMGAPGKFSEIIRWARHHHLIRLLRALPMDVPFLPNTETQPFTMYMASA